MNWGRETSPRPCTSRNERNFPRIRSLLHMAPTSQNDQPQRIERKFLAQTVRTDGQSLPHSLSGARRLNSLLRYERLQHASCRWIASTALRAFLVYCSVEKL